MTKTEKDLYDFIIKRSICDKNEIRCFFGWTDQIVIDLITLLNTGYIQERKTNLGYGYMRTRK